MTTPVLVALYLVALAVANLTVFALGQPALLLTALVLVPLDFAVRVRLQERWRRQRLLLWVNMTALTVAGGWLAYVIAPDSSRIVYAGVVAFLMSATLGSLVYEAIRQDGSAWDARVGCVGVMACADTALFTYLAFDQISVLMLVGQIVMKWIVAYALLRTEVV